MVSLYGLGGLGFQGLGTCSLEETVRRSYHSGGR